MFSFESDAGQRCYECCSKAVELSPSNPEGYQLLASCLLSQQLQEKAREALMKGLGIWLPSCHGKKETEDKVKEEATALSEEEVCLCVLVDLLGPVPFSEHQRGCPLSRVSTCRSIVFRASIFPPTPPVWVWPSCCWSWRSIM